MMKEKTVSGDVGILTPLTIPMVWFFIGIIIAGAFISYKTQPEIGLASMLILIVVFGVVGVFPIWIVVLIGLCVGLILTYLIRGAFTGGGG